MRPPNLLCSAYRVCKRWSTLVWTTQTKFTVKAPDIADFKNYRLLTNLEKLRLDLESGDVDSSIFTHIPSFRKLEKLNVMVPIPSTHFGQFAETAFGLARPSLSSQHIGSLRNLKILVLTEVSEFRLGNRAPVVNAIVRTCPLLTFLRLPLAERDLFTPEDVTEYEEALSSISTLSRLDTLVMAQRKPFFDWSSLRACKMLRKLVLLFRPPRTLASLLGKAQSALAAHIASRKLAFVEIFCDGRPFAPADLASLNLLLDSYGSSNICVTAEVFSSMCLLAIELGSSDALRHPTLQNSLEKIIKDEEYCSFLVSAAIRCEAPVELLPTILSIDRRLFEVRKRAHKGLSLWELWSNMSSVTLKDSLVAYHDQIVEAFPGAFPAARRFLWYLNDSRWVPEVEKMVGGILADSGNEDLAALFFPPKGMPYSNLMEPLLFECGSDDAWVRSAAKMLFLVKR